MELKSYLEVIKRRKSLIFLTIFSALAVSIVITLIIPNVYSTSTTLRIASSVAGSLSYQEYMYNDRLTNTYIKIATSTPVIEELMERLQLTSTPEINVEGVPNTELLLITAEYSNPLQAQSIANTLATILIEDSRNLYVGAGKSLVDLLSEQISQQKQDLEKASQDYELVAREYPTDTQRLAVALSSLDLEQRLLNSLLDQYEQARLRENVRANIITVVEPASLPDRPVRPNLIMNLALGVIAGLLGGSSLAFVLHSLDTTLYTARQIEHFSQIQILAKIPVTAENLRLPPDNWNTPMGESFRQLRTSLLAKDRDPALRTLLITSADAGEGKTTVVCNLAFALAQSGKKTLLVDADLRLPKIHNNFKLNNRNGLSDILENKIEWQEVIKKNIHPNLGIITSGPLPKNPVELLDSSKMPNILEQMAIDYEFVLIDSPSMLSVTDSSVLVSKVNGVVLVARQARLRQEELQAVIKQLTTLDANLLGVVVTGTEAMGKSYYYYNHNHNHRRVKT